MRHFQGFFEDSYGWFIPVRIPAPLDKNRWGEKTGIRFAILWDLLGSFGILWDLLDLLDLWDCCRVEAFGFDYELK